MMKRWAASHPLTAYFLLAYGIAWMAWIPLAVLARFSIFQLQDPLFKLAPFAASPLAASLIMAHVAGGRAAVIGLLRRMVAWRAGLRWYLFVLCSPVLLMLAGAYLQSLAGGPAVDMAAIPIRLMYPDINPLALLPVVFISGLLTGPLNEEAGWRGFALPQLQARWSPLTASLVLGVLWAVWHLPLFFIPGLSQYGQPFLLFLLSVVVNTFFYTWVANATGGSVLMAILLHDAFNSFSAFVPTPITNPWVIGVTAAAAAIVVLAAPGRWLRQTPEPQPALRRPA